MHSDMSLLIVFFRNAVPRIAGLLPLRAIARCVRLAYRLGPPLRSIDGRGFCPANTLYLAVFVGLTTLRILASPRARQIDTSISAPVLGSSSGSTE